MQLQCANAPSGAANNKKTKKDNTRPLDILYPRKVVAAQEQALVQVPQWVVVWENCLLGGPSPAAVQPGCSVSLCYLS